MALNWDSNRLFGMTWDRHFKNRVQPLPYGVYLGALMALCAAGLALSVYLAFSHYRVHTDFGFQSFCALTKAINCDTVSQSPYAVFGRLPVAVWGAAGYAFFLILLTLRALAEGDQQRVWTLSLVTASVFSLASLFFAAVSSFGVGSYCLLCIATYAVNFLLLYFTWITRQRLGTERLRPAFIQDLLFLNLKRRFSLPLLAAFSAAMLATLLFFPPYWKLTLPQTSLPVPTGLTEDGHPWIGAEKPVVEIVEFTDYLCFQCRKMHYYLREIVARHPGKIRLIHRNYPMDHEFNPIVTEPFHVGSGRMALLAVHAALNGKFLEVNDLFFEKAASGEAIALADIARATGIDPREWQQALSHEPYRRHLLLDIRYGMKLRIMGTPGYLINGKVYEGGLPPEVLKSMMEAVKG
jgi:uncharacterized membrane protein/protein-disulfide isomerase